MSFIDFKIEKNNGYIKLSSFRILTTYPETEEKFFLGTPECWDKVVNEVMEPLRLVPYYIYHEIIPLSQCNSITDYKKIWGLKNIEHGESEISYILSYGKVYLGIKKCTPNISFPANIVLYLPESTKRNLDIVINLFKENYYEFCETSYSCVLHEITNIIPGSYILHYYVKDSMCYLIIYGNNSDLLFENKLFTNYNENTSPVYKVGL